MPGGVRHDNPPRRTKPEKSESLLQGDSKEWQFLSVPRCAHPEPVSPRFSEDIDALCKRGEAAVYKEIMNPPRRGMFEEQADILLLGANREPAHDPESSGPNDAILNVYDLNEDVQAANKLLAFSSETLAVGGFFHVGVEVFGSEWSFGCLGVSSQLPRTKDTCHVYRCSVDLGAVAFGRAKFAAIVWKMCQEWRGADYRILGKNCCDFASDLILRLGVRDMPGWVDRFARLVRPGHQAGEQFLSIGSGVLGALEAVRARAFQVFALPAPNNSSTARRVDAVIPEPIAIPDSAAEDEHLGKPARPARKERKVVLRWPQPSTRLGLSSELTANSCGEVASVGTSVSVKGDQSESIDTATSDLPKQGTSIVVRMSSTDKSSAVHRLRYRPLVHGSSAEASPATSSKLSGRASAALSGSPE